MLFEEATLKTIRMQIMAIWLVMKSLDEPPSELSIRPPTQSSNSRTLMIFQWI